MKKAYIQKSTHLPTYRRQVILEHILKHADKYAKMDKGAIKFSVYNGKFRKNRIYSQTDCDRIFNELYGE